MTGEPLSLTYAFKAVKDDDEDDDIKHSLINAEMFDVNTNSHTETV